MRRGPIFYLPSNNLACACVKPIAASCSLFGITPANVPESIEKSSPPKWGAFAIHLFPKNRFSQRAVFIILDDLKPPTGMIRICDWPWVLWRIKIIFITVINHSQPTHSWFHAQDLIDFPIRQTIHTKANSNISYSHFSITSHHPPGLLPSSGAGLVIE